MLLKSELFSVPIHIFLWSHAVDNPFCINSVDRVKGQLDYEPMNFGVLIDFHYTVHNLQNVKQLIINRKIWC